MIKYYTSRYMDLAKCAEIKREGSCVRCGSELEGRHETDFASGHVREVRMCSQCQNEPQVLEHALQ